MLNTISKTLFSSFLFLLSWQGWAFEIYTDFPQQIKPDQAYVIYSHGLIVEGDNPRPRHPEFGYYEFEEIKQALFENANFNLIAHHRPANTDIAEYAQLLERWVRDLVKAGASPSAITLVGFSRGSHLTAFASSKLNDLSINTVLLASCYKGNIESKEPLQLSGHLLNIYETTDLVKSCSKLAEQSKALESFKEVAISTGKKHGAFYRPYDDWVAPLKMWIEKYNQ